ncbi:MAG: septal ring lytic transglycosylase RlpA family protein [Methyloprofundus sp.]|nr:septal ring lytic transglycosylase RlpA family protein [Methyloprofundus sp.]
MSKILPRHFSYLIFASLCAISSQSIAAEEGIASYYADKYHGRKTASGALYDKNKMTAAHRTLKFGTKVKVTDLKNNKSVVVTVNDRGPYSKKRIIDLSYVAAKKIGLIKAGLSKVRVEIVK